MRTMSMPEYHPKPAEVFQKPRCVVSSRPNTKTIPINTSPSLRDINKTAVGGAQTITTCSTPGSRIQAAEQSAPLQSSSRHTVHRRSGSQPLQPSNEENRSPLNPVGVRRPRPLTVGDGPLRVEPFQHQHLDHPVSIPRRRSMRMLDLENSTVARPDSLYLDTGVDSARQRSQQTSVAPKDTRRVEDPARRVNTAVETRDRLIVFPSTRLVF